jgi:hypothetical protein
MKFKKILPTFILLPLILIGFSYIKFLNLDVYYMEKTKISFGDLSYKTDYELMEKYNNGELKTEKVIGKIGEYKSIDHWWIGNKVYKIKGIDQREAILVRGYMFQDVLRISNDSFLCVTLFETIIELNNKKATDIRRLLFY